MQFEFIAQARPELKGRLPVITGNERPVAPFATLDMSATENILGLKNYVKWQDTVGLKRRLGNRGC